jgi:competence protein ComEC
MLARFRRTGLSHLTAVSGQNVALVLAAASPLLRRLTGRPRVGVTLILIAWFVVITRLEPSIIRAGVMAALAVIARATGREGSPVRLLALAVCMLLIIDPLLAQSVGFQLSVGATAGVAALANRLGERLSALGPLALPVGVTLGAQIGVLVPSALVFGRLPLVGLIANVLAVPIAGLVMLLGLPIAIIAAPAPPLGSILMLPMRLGVRWVDTIAVLADRLEPERAAVGWWAHGCAAALLLLWVVIRRHRTRLINTQ